MIPPISSPESLMPRGALWHPGAPEIFPNNLQVLLRIPKFLIFLIFPQIWLLPLVLTSKALHQVSLFKVWCIDRNGLKDDFSTSAVDTHYFQYITPKINYLFLPRALYDLSDYTANPVFSFKR